MNPAVVRAKAARIWDDLDGWLQPKMHTAGTESRVRCRTAQPIRANVMISGNDMTGDAGPAPDDTASAPPDYAYKPSLMGAPMEFRLAEDALEWRRGST